jgi:hypothetical protein
MPSTQVHPTPQSKPTTSNNNNKQQESSSDQSTDPTLDNIDPEAGADNICAIAEEDSDADEDNQIFVAPPIESPTDREARVTRKTKELKQFNLADLDMDADDDDDDLEAAGDKPPINTDFGKVPSRLSANSLVPDPTSQSSGEVDLESGRPLPTPKLGAYGEVLKSKSILKPPPPTP